MKTYRFTALIHGDPHQNIAFVEFPFDVEKEFGCKGRIKSAVLLTAIPIADPGLRWPSVPVDRPDQKVRQAIGKARRYGAGGVAAEIRRRTVARRRGSLNA